MNLDKLLTLQLRPHVARMLDDYTAQVRAKLPETLRAKITRSLIVRKLIKRQVQTRAALAYIGNRRFRDQAAHQLRVRCTSDEYETAKANAQVTEVPMATLIAALIVEALHPDGNYPANPDTNTATTKDGK